MGLEGEKSAAKARWDAKNGNVAIDPRTARRVRLTMSVSLIDVGGAYGRDRLAAISVKKSTKPVTSFKDARVVATHPH
jgi:hypothetical protein